MSEDKLHVGQLVHTRVEVKKGLGADLTTAKSTQLGEGFEARLANGRERATASSPEVVAQATNLIANAVQTRPDRAPAHQTSPAASGPAQGDGRTST